MMIACDYCKERMSDRDVRNGRRIIIQGEGATATTDANSVKVDLHSECFSPWKDGVTAITGDRPADPGPTP